MKKKLSIIKANKKQVYTQLLIGILIIAGLCQHMPSISERVRVRNCKFNNKSSLKGTFDVTCNDNLSSQMALEQSYRNADTNYKRQNQD